MSKTYEDLEKQLKVLFPDGFILLHKNGRLVNFRLSEFEYWLGRIKEVLDEETDVYKNQVKL